VAMSKEECGFFSLTEKNCIKYNFVAGVWPFNFFVRSISIQSFADACGSNINRTGK
jgi:hypothetical protein